MLIKQVSEALKRYDDALRLRWSKEKGTWLVERKVARGTFANRPCHYESDRYYQWRDGYLPCGLLPPKSEFYEWEVDLMLRNLYEGDIWKAGGADSLNLKLDKEFEREQIQIDNQNATETSDRAGDFYEDLAWREKRRVTVPANLEV